LMRACAYGWKVSEMDMTILEGRGKEGGKGGRTKESKYFRFVKLCYSQSQNILGNSQFD
jgi:hypothetical protein